MTTLERRLVVLQQKLEHLNTEVAALLALTSSDQQTVEDITHSNANQSVATAASHTPKSSVGINRYHQLLASN